MTGWLPDILRLNDFGGDWNAFIEAVYAVFQNDFLHRTTRCSGLPVYVNQSLEEGRCKTFWHLVSEGAIEADRIPDTTRCGHVPWFKPVIEEFPANRINWWENSDRGEKRLLLATSGYEFLVILAHRPRHYFLISGYPVERERRRQKLRTECAAFHGTAEKA